MEVKYLVENINLTGLTEWLNENEDFEKQTGTKFNTNDVNQYLRLGHLPHYMGGNKIDESDLKTTGVKLYNLRK